MKCYPMSDEDQERINRMFRAAHETWTADDYPEDNVGCSLIILAIVLFFVWAFAG